MNRHHIRNAVHLMAMITVAVLALRCDGTGGDPGPDPGHPHAHSGPQLDTRTGLLVTSRSSLQVCLQVDPVLREQSEALAAQLREGLMKMKDHPDWKAAKFQTEVPEVILGCPGGAWPSEAVQPKDTVLGPGVTGEPSPYRTFVYAVAEPTAERALGAGVANRAIAEMVRVGDHQLAEVSTALVVRASELGSARVQTYWLPWSLGLVPVGGFDWEREPPKIDHDPKAAPDPSLEKPRTDDEVQR